MINLVAGADVMQMELLQAMLQRLSDLLVGQKPVNTQRANLYFRGK